MPLHRSVYVARLCGAGVVLSSLLSGGANAADLLTKAPPVPYATDDFWTRPYLFGDLGRTKLKEQGIELGLTLGDEAVGNLSGGSKNTAANAGQLWFGAKFDMGKLVGIQGGTIGLTLVDRFGKNLNTEAGIPALQLTNEVFGRGNILRLTQLYYSQKLFDDRLELKGGRLPVGSDFFFGLCEFINLTFCGGQPGNIQGGYIYNWPVSQWAGVVHYKFAPEFTISAGVYDANPNYLTTDDPTVYFLPGVPHSTPASGVLVPVELVWTPKAPLTGTWRFGGWYDSASTIDGGMPGIISTVPGVGGVPDQNLGDQRGRYGVYESILQRLTVDGAGAVGWYAFLNTTVADHRTSYQDYQIAGGFKHTGTFAWRPQDEVGFAVGTTHVNSAALSPNAGGNEVPLEVWYGWQATGWMNLKFDAQYVINPGGRGYNGAGVKTDNAVVLGMRTEVHF
ncbi:carbohydrate porin [Bradyrhizobium guangdongense]|uniref:Porin n=1 Tax=Bradyrhizobium guangdongense TaxID=1325090 RepID=A0A410V208_9BRAD|nr:carbohydrate porin [Bradyrhizobium guangdongense]QAU37723.1 carbohydrate porin [Bradyrhizobium guangdongense]QOZ58780.1 carbohydrate porin [Bradyrhizobium guangdongense]GGI19691.1 porin [Bradyrhizobium guangdongense]